MIAAPAPDLTLTTADFARIAALVHKETGITLSGAKRPFLVSRLTRRVRKLGLGGFGHYIDLLTAPDGAAERQELISAVTTNVTAFYREAHHFECLARDVLPALLARAKQGGRVRLWSAGCATGPEVWTIAGIILHLCPTAARHDLRVLATDIDRAALAQAMAGEYTAAAVEPLPQGVAAALLAPDGRTIGPEARRLVHFGQLNLLGPWPMRGSFDAIFCRNVAIYFDRPTQDVLWPRFADVLAPGGWLMIGHSERLFGRALDTMAPAGITTYRKAGQTP